MRAACRPRLRFLVALGLLALVCLLPSASALAGTTPNPPAPYLDPAYASRLLALVQDRPEWQSVEMGAAQGIQNGLGDARLAAIRASLPDPKGIGRFCGSNGCYSGALQVRSSTQNGWKWLLGDTSQSNPSGEYAVRMGSGLGALGSIANTPGFGSSAAAYWTYLGDGQRLYLCSLRYVCGYAVQGPVVGPTWALTFSGGLDDNWGTVGGNIFLEGCPSWVYAPGQNWTWCANFDGNISSFTSGVNAELKAFDGTFGAATALEWVGSGVCIRGLGPYPSVTPPDYPCSAPPPVFTARLAAASAIPNDPVAVSSALSPSDLSSNYYDAMQLSATQNAYLNWDLDAARAAIGSDAETTNWVDCELTQGPTSTGCTSVPATLTLSAPSPRSSPFTGKAVSFSVSVGNVSDASGTELTATVTGANSKTISATVNGTTATFSYTGSNTGADSVRVSGAIAGHTLSSNSVSVKWLAGSNSSGRHLGDPTGRLTRPAVPIWPDPINAYTGNYYQSSTDVDLPGTGIPFSFERTYNSLDTNLGALGKGWSANLFPKLSADSEGNMHLRAGDGQEVDFALLSDGSYAADSDVSASLTKTATGFDLLLHNQDVQHFNAEGRLISWLDPNGQGLHLSYGSDGRLASVADAGGREVTFTYDDSGRLTQITLPDGSTVSYGYDGDFLTSFTDQLGSVTRYAYDENGYLTSVVDPTGKLVVRNSYDDEGRVTGQTDALGNTNTYDWSSNSGVGTDANGSVWKHSFTDDGQLSEGVDPLGNEQHYVYNDANDLLSTTDALGKETTMTYDARGNVLTSTDALGNTESWTYDENNNVVSSTDGLGHVTRFTYDSNGNQLTETDPTGAVTTNEYDSAGRLVSTTDPLGRTTRNVYDDQGNLIATISPSGAKTTMRYDSLGQEIAETDPLGNTTTFEYDAAGRLVKTTNALGHSTTSTYDAAGHLIATTDANGNTTRYIYDDAGHQVAVIDPDGSTTRSAYDSVDNLISTTDTLGNVTRYEYDALDRQTAEISPTGERTITRYDANGDVIAEVDPLADKTTTTYDALGREVSSTDSLGRTTKTVYDAAGNIVETIDPMGGVTTSEYDADGNLIRTTDPLGHSVTSTYDAAGQLVAETDANEHTTRYAYDLDGHKISVTAPDGSVTSYAYDANGNLVKRTDANGHVTTYSYNALGQKTKVVNPLGSTWTYSYDPNGNLVKTVTAIGNATSRPGDGEITMTYDSQNRLIKKSYSDGTPSVSYTYDANGAKVSMTDGTGKTTYAYDPNGRLIAVSGPSEGFLYRYDEDGNLLSRTYPNGLETTYSYDSDGEMVTATVNGKKTYYTYDQNGNLASTLHPNGILDTRSYDAAGRVTDISGKTSDGKLFYSRTYTYDPVGNPLTLDAVNAHARLGNWRKPTKRTWKESYSYDSSDRLVQACMNASCSRYFKYFYDPVGNRTQLQTKTGTTLYSYDAADELVSASQGKHDRSLYSYDANGNETQAGSTHYDYNLENELTQVTGQGEKTSYTYSGDGLMAARSTRFETTSYAWDTNFDLPEMATETDSRGSGRLASTDTRSYTYGVGPIGIVDKNETYTFHTDSLGSVIELSDNRGSLVASYRYTPFGEAYGGSEASESGESNPIRFTGQYLDSGSDLYDMRAREYDPETGRFLETDPQTCDSNCASSYVYADDEPTELTDPSGEKSMLPDPPLVSRPKSIHVTFLIQGQFKATLQKGRKAHWRYEKVDSDLGWRVCAKSGASTSGLGPNWVYDDTSPSSKYASRDAYGIFDCYLGALLGLHPSGRGYVYMAPNQGTSGWRKHNLLGVPVTRYYAELYGKRGSNPRLFLPSWNYSIGSPVVSVNYRTSKRAAHDRVASVCESNKLPSGGWMGIWAEGFSSGVEAVPRDTLEGIENGLNECTR